MLSRFLLVLLSARVPGVVVVQGTRGRQEGTGGQEPQECGGGEDDTQTDCPSSLLPHSRQARSLLQSASRKKLLSVVTQPETSAPETSAPFAWAASSYGDCMPECGSQQFRTVTCASVFDGQKDVNGTCSGFKPASAQACVCGGSEACAAAPAEGCPVAEPSSGADFGGYVQVGCYTFKEPSGKSLYHDMACMTWDAAAPCNSGLPFYAVKGPGMDVNSCYRFCISKGMDIFGLQYGKICRCGASALNKEVWHEEAPRANLVFNPSALTAADAAKHCPLEVYRYKGHYEDDGVPSSYWDIKEDDIEYVDSVVTGKEVGEGTEEDGMPEKEEKAEGLAQQDGKNGQSPGFDRPCWPGNCGPGRGPWRDRSSRAPPGTRDVWRDYVLVKFAYEHDVDTSRKAAFRAAVKQWNSKTCINLIEQTAALSGPGIKVGIYDTEKCYLSGKGHGSSELNLGWCNSMRHVGNIMHEIGHAVGMNHEQKRPDAAARYHGHGPHLKLYWDQIPDRWVSQYLPDASSYTGSANDGPADPHAGYAEYDFGSIMHYSGSDRYDTIPFWKEWFKVGQRKALSAGDIEEINDMYQCLPKPTPAPSPPTVAWPKWPSWAPKPKWPSWR